MDSDPGRPWRLAPGVLLDRAGTGGLLLDLDRGFFALDPPGADALARAIELGPGAAVRSLAERHDIGEAEAAVEVEGLRRELAARSLLEGTGGSTPHPVAGVLARAVPAACVLWDRYPAGSARLLLALAWAAIRAEGFASTVRRWRPIVPRMASPVDPGRVDRAVRRASCAYLLPPVACKERAVAVDLLLRSGGLRPEVVVAVRPRPFSAHTWAECDGRVIGDDPARCARFRRVAVLEPGSGD